MVRRPVPCLVSFALAFANLWSAYRRKMRPRTGTEYSDDFSFELARSSSAAPQRRFSSSVVLAGMVVLAHRLPEFKFESLQVFLDHLHQKVQIPRLFRPSLSTFERDSFQN